MVSATFGMAANEGYFRKASSDTRHSYSGQSREAFAGLETAGASPSQVQAFSANLPMFDQVQEQQDNSATLMEALRPNDSYQAQPVEISALKLDVTQRVTTADKVSDSAHEAMADVQQNMSNFQTDFTDARAEACEALRGAAESRGIDPALAIRSIVPDPDATKATAVGAMAATGGAAFLGPVVGAISNAAYLKGEIQSENTKLPPDEIEALIRETLVALQSKPVDDTRMSGGSASYIPDETHKDSTRFNWSNLDAQKLTELLRTDPTGKDQPEMQTLLSMEKALKGVFENHAYVADHYADSNLGVKLDGAQKAEVAAIITQDVTIEEAPRFYDATDVALHASSLGETTMRNRDTAPLMLSVSYVAEHLTEQDLAIAAPKFRPELNADVAALRR